MSWQTDNQWRCTIFFHLLLFKLTLSQNDTILPKPGECGQIEYGSELDSTRIRSRLGEHPWVVSIGYWYPSKENSLNIILAYVNKNFNIIKINFKNTKNI